MIAVEYSLLITAGTLQFSMTFILAFMHIYAYLFYKQRNYGRTFYTTVQSQKFNCSICSISFYS